MLSKVLSYGLVGINGYKVEIEVDIGRGLSGYEVVGMGDVAVKEARDRVRSGIENSGFTFPLGRILTNLAPADIKKEGSNYDLAMALGVLCSSGIVQVNNVCDYIVIGEMGLNGAIRGVNGILPLIISARKDGFKKFIVPKLNEREACLPKDVEIYAISSLKQTVAFLNSTIELKPSLQEDVSLDENPQTYMFDFKYVKGQNSAKRAIEIAVSGGHNMIMVGAPGSGKTMLAKCLPSIMPPMTYEEALEVTKIHSVAGALDENVGVITTRPFRSPHHTATIPALTGGGKNAKPGEISLAHNGVLFLDEMPEYSRHALETLRQPLEDGVVTVARVLQTVEYPARFMLVASMNPCPCGNYGSVDRVCKCSQAQISKYLSKLSAPLLDRIDLHVEVDSVKYDDLNSNSFEEESKVIRERVAFVRKLQQERFENDSILCNDQMASMHLNKYCALSEECQNILKMAFEKLNLSARAYSRILKVSRTIADMAKEENILPSHIAEAIQYRALDRKYWS